MTSKDNKKILMVAGPFHSNPPLKGAAVETWMYEVSKRIVGFEPHIVSIDHPFYPIREYRDGIFFHRIHFSRLYKRLFQKITRLDPLSYPKRISMIVDEVQPDIVHMHNSIKWFASLVEYIRKKEIKTVLHMTNEIHEIANMKIDALVGCSNFIVDVYKNSLIKAGRHSCIYNGVDLEKFKPYWEVYSSRDNIKKGFEIDKKDFVVLFVGRISPEKGVEHFIKSALMFKDRPNVKFIAVGEIRKGDIKNDRVRYAKEIINIAAPLKDKIIFTGGIPPAKIHQLYLLGDVLILPSNFEEPFSMVAIEAMATGLPVIARKRGGLKEYIVDEVNGFFIDDRTPAVDIAKKVTDLMADKELRDSIGRNGRKTAEERFSWEKITSDVEKFYSQLLLS